MNPNHFNDCDKRKTELHVFCVCVSEYKLTIVDFIQQKVNNINV